MGIEVFFVKNPRVISAIELEKCMTSASIFDIVVSELRYGKKPCPIILFEDDEGSKIGFYCIILLFGLTINLWIEGSGEFPLNTKEIT